jgi:signal transduction histidine kinase
MVSALFKDWTVRISALAWLAVLSLYVVPGVGQTFLETFGERYAQIPTLLPVIAAAWIGISRVADLNERRFWVILGVGFACWFAGGLPLALVSDEHWSLGFDVVSEVGYLLFYIFMILAIELRPHEQHTGSLNEKERQLRAAGLTLLGFFLLSYFALVPAGFRPDSLASSLPAFVMYVLLDIVIAGRLLWMQRDAWSVRWTALYAWLAAGALIMTAGDIIEGLSWLDDTHWVPEFLIFRSGTWLDHLWTVPGLIFVFAIRARHVQFPSEQRVINEPPTSQRTTRAGHVLVISALSLPFLHYAFYAAGVFQDTALRPLREVVSVTSMVVLGGLAISAYRALERQRDQMEASELGLLNELAAARKMDAVARLADSVANDFNNLVQVVRGRAEIIGQQIETGSPLHDDVRQIRAAAARAADLASQLMTFGRKQVAQTTAVRLHDLLRRSERLLKPLLDDRMRLQLQLHAAADVVRLDPLQFERIVLNLATNARDAMPEGGTITIATATPDAGSRGQTGGASPL